MNKIINKPANIVMLPTKDKTSIIKRNNNLLFLLKPEFVENENLHLYVTTDERTIVGDCILKDSIVGTLKHSKSKGYWVSGSDHQLKRTEVKEYKKVIASTNSKLTQMVEDTRANSMDNNNIEYYHYSLPKLTNEFIENYCKQGGVNKVFVKYYEFEVENVFSESEKRILAYEINSDINFPDKYIEHTLVNHNNFISITFADNN